MQIRFLVAAVLVTVTGCAPPRPTTSRATTSGAERTAELFDRFTVESCHEDIGHASPDCIERFEASAHVTDPRAQAMVDAERDRAHVVRTIGAAFSAAGASIQAQPPASPVQPMTPPTMTSGPSPRVTMSGPAKVCSSDYECSPGEACVKHGMEFNGTCMTTVNRFGTPTYSAPRLDSLNPGRGECQFDTQCSIGFRCDKGTSLSGNCIK